MATKATTAATDATSSPTGKEQASARDLGAPKIGTQGNIRRVDIETANPVVTIDHEVKDKKNVVAGAPDKGSDVDDRSDDGLQADERSLKTDLAQEQKRKDEKDVVLTEGSRILGDEIDLIRSDTKLAAQVLPHPGPGKDSVD